MHRLRRLPPLASTVALLALAALAPTAAAQSPAAPAPAAPAPAAPSGGALQLEWGHFDRANRPVARALRRSRAIQRVVDLVNRTIALPRDIPILISDQSDIGPAYLPDVRLAKGRTISVILFPGWFLSLELRSLRGELRGVRGLSARRALAYANQFIVAHEIGHALVDQLDLPITGREEDAVDGFAAHLLTEDPRFGPMAPVSAAVLFDAIKTDDGRLGDSDFADEHSLPQQRVYQFLCWVYGSDTRRFRGIVGPDMLPRDRAARCRGEYRQLRSSWTRLLAAHLRARPGPA